MEQKMIAYIIIAVAALLLFYAGSNFLKQNYFGENYQKALAAQGEDKCKAPEGYTESEWKEHMGHHPDQFAECLKK